MSHIPRLFVSSQDSNAVRIISATNKVNITLSNIENEYTIGTSNSHFIIDGGNANLDFYYDSNISKTRLNIPTGVLSTDRIELSNSRDRIVFDRVNPLSSHQFAGFGYDGSNIIHQLSGEIGQKHIFKNAINSLESTPILQVGINSVNQNPQVIIGNITGSNESLIVDGSALVTGNLEVSGKLDFDKTGLVQVDNISGRIDRTQIPTGVVYLNNSNQIDTSILPQQYSFQFLRGRQNIGIGTREPSQKLHVIGSTIISDRLGIGAVTNPEARLHIVETQNSQSPTLKIQNTTGGPIMKAYTSSGAPAMSIPGTRAGITIGSDEFTTLAGNDITLEVTGSSLIHGNMTLDSNIIASGYVQGSGFRIPNAMDIGETAVFNKFVNFNGSLATSNITTVGSASYINIQNAGLNIEGDVFMRGQMYILSDARTKTNIQPLKYDRIYEILDNLRGYTYIQGGRESIGVLAQEIAQFVPEAVQQFPQSEYSAVSYDSLIPILIECIRDLNKQVKELQSIL